MRTWGPWDSTLRIQGLMGTAGLHLDTPSRMVWTELGNVSTWTKWLPLHMNGLISPARTWKRHKRVNKMDKINRYMIHSKLTKLSWYSKWLSSIFWLCVLENRTAQTARLKFLMEFTSDEFYTNLRTCKKGKISYFTCLLIIYIGFSRECLCVVFSLPCNKLVNGSIKNTGLKVKSNCCLAARIIMTYLLLFLSQQIPQLREQVYPHCVSKVGVPVTQLSHGPQERSSLLQNQRTKNLDFNTFVSL